MREDPIGRWFCDVFGVASILACLVTPALAESTPEGTSVVGVRAGAACLKEQVRISGFALAREESGASVPLEGYRITEILVGEGDTVTAGQELLRATRLGAEAGRPAQALPPSYSLRAPIAGRITKLNVRVGMVTSLPSAAPSASGQPPEPQVRIMADAGIDLLVDVPSLFVTKIRTGLTARILSEDGREAAGTVRVPASEVDPATQLGRARLSVEPATALRPGQFASAVLETARDCGLSVPRTAVSYRNGEATVQVLNGTAVETRSVRTGLFDENTIRISDGLSEGEPIVANSGNDLRAGDKVRAVIPAAGGASR
ncbi:efflux RND transporter periplasmic adaptor subunit [Methylobacterium brachythecii]|uniref:Multidrug efflux pump subunit AcrA (Membrane-fusion protein) n=1 Tax=Methylobacterium brachythecii TaxID=1176177 RepID=A0A7W6AGS8_9HYPH|nr:secretion protein HylD [Methylobacterium brachythecii]MBB3901155.1 multidrug efflux pump subunit AcrA (membrane-fusion protein) [Methylobacterium brachythecii]GLS44659.1 hypothetical protein GCM10007884_26470 [Methylobacterium brachythecii]